ncbi:molybdopterin-dependent oxidoreductase [Paenibacillus cremeus]|uniref:Molybdopterin-dependent oxidoreductase n=1 Tax=Paenibacillus cremeus TaxID=2163881 RepID=A0A559K5L1_9BACL|nr:molybdopterin-dependent oxidoreductase [Paenibacillus cremeus]TVY07400.1 molybdopterin-dependent oxidoreductase [Paenibacillus cremeus]
MKIAVYDEIHGSAELEVQELAGLGPMQLRAEERIPGVTGKAFDLMAWYEAWCRIRKGSVLQNPTRLQVEAADEFQASVPWNELGQAMFLYAQENGEPLQKGYPIRLYVPDGSSECLNVKSVVRIRFDYGNSEDLTATYGFKNVVSPDQLKKGKAPNSNT